MEQTRVGIIGCGAISATYLKNCSELFGNIVPAAVADLVPERARARAAEFGVARVCTVEELLASPDLPIVLNLTIPKVHAEVSRKALEAGKHVYVEKPIAVRTGDALDLVRFADSKRLRIGVAPDTFLGAGLQTCRKLIDDGWIGEPVAASAFLAGHGHESWHPDPEFYYKSGGGPLFDMGPYYLTALVSLIGPVQSVCGAARATFPKRTITSAPKRGQEITVEVPTHVIGTLAFANGALASITTSFDVWSHTLPHLEIYGTTGTLRLPDPNTFGGPVYVRRFDTADWKEMPLTHGFAENSRGLGLADLASAIQGERDHRANERIGLHVLDIMEKILEAAGDGRTRRLETSCERPAPTPPNAPFGASERIGR